MHRTIGYLSKRVIHLEPGEHRKVLLTFLYFFLIITAYYVMKPVSRSLILGELGSRLVPYMDLVCAVLMGPFVTLFAHFVDRVPKPKLVGTAFMAVAAVVGLFWVLLSWPGPWTVGLFYIWVAMFSVLVVTLFWLVANDLYHPREAKRLFGFIGSGGILGGIVGSSIAAVGAQLIGTHHLLLLSAGLLLVCWFLVERLWQFAPPHAADAVPSGAAHHDTFLSDVGAFTKLVLRSRYLLLLIALVGINKLVATLVYYQFNPFIEQAFPEVNARTTFTGLYFGGLNAVSFLIQFFFTSWVLRRWGLRTALVLLPGGLLLGTTGLVLMPLFWLAAVTELYDGAMNYSLQQTTKEILYLPIDRSVRYKVKPFIDMVVFRFGKGTAAVVGILLLDLWHLPARVLGFVTVPLVVVWLVVALWLRRGYVETIRMMLQARAAARPQPPGRPSSTSGEPGGAWGGELMGAFGSLTDGRVPSAKLALIDRLVGPQTGDGPPIQALRDELTAYEGAPMTLTLPAPSVAHLQSIIGDQRAPMPMRRQAIRLLVRSATQDAIDYLVGLLMVEEDALLRREAIVGLVKLRVRQGRFELPGALIRRQVEREVGNHRRITQIAHIYQQHYRGAPDADDPVLALLRFLLEESVEQVFRLLMVLHPPEDVHLVYEQMRSAESYVRADALELLDNLVDPAMRTILLPIFNEDRFLACLEPQDSGQAPEPTVAYRVLQEAIWDHNCWLSVATLCAIGRLRLTTMRPELEKASRHTMPAISAAANVALHLSGSP